MLSPALPALIDDLQFTVHGEGAGQWYAVKTPNQRFLRVGRCEYVVASCLDGVRTTTEVLSAVHAIDSAHSLSEQAVLEIVSGLTRIGMIAVPEASAAEATEAAKFSLNPVYMKIPLVGGQHLERVGAWLAPLVSLPALGLVMILWIVAAISVLTHWDWFASLTGKLFVSDGWMWWGLAWLTLKTAHELGHAVTAVSVGSSIRSAGISLIFMAPVPYVDLTDLWAIPSRWQRMLCCAGGMLVELFLAAVAALVALSTENPSLQYFCCAVATMGTVTTLAFNASPLMRFDGYYIFSDLVNYPNLYTDGQLAAKQFVFKCLRPWRQTQHRLALKMVLYGLACYQYRLVMMLSLALGTILAMQGVGVVLVAWGAYAVVVAPLLRRCSVPVQQITAAQHQPSGTGLSLGRLAKFGEPLWSGTVVVGLCLLLLLVPAPIQPSLPGYVALRDPQLIRSETDGFLSQVLVPGGDAVQAGQLIARLTNPELEVELSLKRNELATVVENIRLKRAQRQLAELQAHEGERAALLLQISQLERRVQGLEVRSTQAGIMVENDLPRRLGLFLKAGEPLAMIAQPQIYEVIASVDQQDVEPLRRVVGQTLAAHISGGGRLAGVLAKVEPRASDRLDEPLLAAIYGGPISVHKQQSPQGDEELKLTQPRFELRLSLEGERAAPITPGQMVWIRIPGKPATLMDAAGRWCSRKWQELVQQNG